jgi:hypothetical protein
MSKYVISSKNQRKISKVTYFNIPKLKNFGETPDKNLASTHTTPGVCVEAKNMRIGLRFL